MGEEVWTASRRRRRRGAARAAPKTWAEQSEEERAAHIEDLVATIEAKQAQLEHDQARARLDGRWCTDAACNHPALITGQAPRAPTAPDAPAVAAADTGMSADDELAELLSGLSVRTQHCERCQVSLPASHPAESGHVLCAGCRAQAKDEAERGIDWGTRSSSKVDKVVKLLDMIHREARDDKTIVFSQFTSFLDLLGPVLQKHGVEFVRCAWLRG